MTNEQWEQMRYFQRGEFVSPDTGEEQMSITLVQFLDALRDYCGIPLVINSGFRSPAHNAAVGGAPDSAHLRGLAVDVRCISSFTRHKILSFALSWTASCRIVRIGVAKTFVHLDIDHELPHPVMWLY
jgi:uncharacterized protein YcbK (DUF882 family)